MAKPVIADPVVPESWRHPACVSCNKAKRRCARQRPACARCSEKGLRCVYPMMRIVLSSSGDDTPPPAVPLGATPSSDDGGVGRGEVAPRRLAGAAEAQAEAPGMPTPPVGVGDHDDPWFLTPSSWKINPSPGTSDTLSFPDSGLEEFIAKVRSWLDRWIEGTHCALIHRRLYDASGRLPDCLCDAYAAYQTYRTSTAENKRAALQVVSTFANRLIDGQAPLDNLGVEALDVQGHLSRTQALVVYQVIRLFDGDIRSRADAEAASATVIRWAYQLMQSAASNLTADDRGNPKPAFHQQAADAQQHDRDVPPLWKAWILSESIRRTWITATLVESAYGILKHGFTACPGDISFTGRAGLWEAESPREWLVNLQAGGGGGGGGGDDGGAQPLPGFPLTCGSMPALMSRSRPDEIDDFTRALVVFGAGRQEWSDWIASAR